MKIKYTLELAKTLLLKSDILIIGNYIPCRNNKVKVKCLKDGYEWDLNFRNFICKGTKCPKCSNCSRLSNDIIDERIKNRGIKRVGNYINALSKIEFECLIDGHKWKATPNKILNVGRGCPKCGGSIRKTIEDFDNILKQRNIKIIGNYKNNKTPIELECLIDGNKWFAKINNVLSGGTGCPFCKNKNEKECLSIIKEYLTFDYIKPHKLFTIEGKRYFVDFYVELEGKRLIIERNGEQHYRVVDFGQGEEKSKIDYEKQIIRDKLIEEFCKNNDILFFIVPYWWSNEECINKIKGLNNGWTSATTRI